MFQIYFYVLFIFLSNYLDWQKNNDEYNWNREREVIYGVEKKNIHSDWKYIKEKQKTKTNKGRHV